MEKTSWNGSLTKTIRAKGWKNAYTRYRDRRARTGIEIVVPHDTHLEIFDLSGHKIRDELKYHNYNSDEITATHTYNTQVKKPYLEYKRRLKKATGR
jgi:hypothetical protein